MERKKVLIITYYWPPSGGGGVMRNLKHSKYFRDYGWEPVIYTAKDAEYPILDHSLEADVPPGLTVLHQPIWEPYHLYKWFTGKKKNERVYSGFLSEKKKPGFRQKASQWIRGNMFIPDARKYWIKPSIKYLKKYLAENPVDAIISSGPPHTTHLIALGIKKAMNIPWLADFRDPWTNIDFYEHLALTHRSDRKHKRLEQEVLQKADEVVTVSWHWAEDFKRLGASEIKVVTNGFDEADFPAGEVKVEPEFSFCHFGGLNNDRNPPVLWEAMKELLEETPGMRGDLKLRFIGKTDVSVFAELEKQGLQDLAEKVDYIPHAQMLDTLVSSPILLLLMNDTPNVLGVVPGKIFEYLGARRPILAIGPTKGDSSRILKECGIEEVCEFTDKEAMKKAIRGLYQRYINGKLHPPEANIGKYSRRNGARQIAGLLDQMLAPK